jgi:hypothetical protein
LEIAAYNIIKFDYINSEGKMSRLLVGRIWDTAKIGKDRGMCMECGFYPSSSIN